MITQHQCDAVHTSFQGLEKESRPVNSNTELSTGAAPGGIVHDCKLAGFSPKSIHDCLVAMTEGATYDECHVGCVYAAASGTSAGADNARRTGHDAR